MKTATDVSVQDDALPYIRYLRDEYWDSVIGGFGVLTPKTVVHTSTGDDGPTAGGDLEIPEIQAIHAASSELFSGIRVSYLLAAARSIRK